MKKNKLYTANKWNQGLFVPSENLFALGGMSQDEFNRWDALASEEYGDKYGDEGYDISDYMNSKNILGISKKNNPLSKGNIGSTVKAAAPAVASALGALGNSALSDGLNSAAGTAISGLGSTIGGAIGTVNPVAGAAVSLGSQLLGGLTNRAFGTSTNEAQKAANDAGTASYNNFNSQASYFDDVQGPVAQGNVVDAHKSGFLNKGWARERNEAQRQARIDARQSAFRSIDNNVNNIVDDQLNEALYNYAAYGGPLEMTNKKNDMGYFGVYRNPDTWFALGGDLQTHGSDWGSGLVHIDAGQSHEENPYDGVQMGVDQEGTPNLVEEGETVFNDYVYSTRIMADEETKKKFHLPKKKEISYADISKKLGKEVAERPNDPYSQAAYEMQMNELANQQERQKQEMEAQRAQEAFAALSPEEQTAIMQQVGQQQAQEQAMQEQAMQQQAIAQQYSPEEMAMMQQQIVGQEAPEGYAYGGNLYAKGGPLRQQVIDWLEKNHPEYNATPQIKGQIVKTLLSMAQKDPKDVVVKKSIRGGKSVEDRTLKQNILGGIYDRILKGTGNTLSPRSAKKNRNAFYRSEGDITSRRRAHFKELVDAGMDKRVAFGIAFPEETQEDYRATGMNAGSNYIYDEDLGFRYDYDAYQKAVKSRNHLYTELVGKPAAKTSQQTQKVPQQSPEIQITDDSKKMKVQQAIPPKSPISNNSTDNVENAVDKAAAAYANVLQRAQGLGADAEEPIIVENSNTGGTGSTGYSGGTPVVSNTGWKPYSWYRNGSDGYSTPTGFTVGDNGLVTAYTPEYRNLVNRLGADSIRQWAKEHPDDPSLKSFLERGNRLEDLTDEQWRRGATDGKYGFMHHVAEEMLNGENGNNENVESPVYNYLLDDEGNTTFLTNDEITEDLQSLPSGDPRVRYFKKNNSTASPKTYHQLEGTDGYLPEDQTTWGKNVGFITGREKLDNGDTVIYHANNSTGTKTAGTSDDDSGNPKPDYKKEWPRYAGIFGPAVGLGLQLAGVGKPDTSGLDAALQIAANGDAGIADYQPIGNYLTYRPMDIWYNQNRMDANSRATDRAILNSAVPQGARMAGLLANGYNSQLGSGELYRNALEYNDNLRKQVADFNRGTDMFNAQAYNQTSLANAQMRARNKALNAQMAMDAAAQKMAADAGWNQGIYGNLSGIFKGLSDIGRENAQWNMISDMWADGLAGTATSKTHSARGHLKDEEKKSKGGKINKRRGFTF